MAPAKSRHPAAPAQPKVRSRKHSTSSRSLSQVSLAKAPDQKPVVGAPGPAPVVQPPGPPVGQPQGLPVGQQQGPPVGQQQGLPVGQQQGPPVWQTQGPPVWQPQGPPVWQQQGPPVWPPQGPPVWQPQGPPVWQQQGPPVWQQQGPPFGQPFGPPAFMGAPGSAAGPGVQAPGATGQRMMIPIQMPMPYLMPQMVPVPGCPPGLEYLCAVDQILVHQMFELIELLIPYEQQNKYVIKNTMGQFVFLAVEESNLGQRCCVGTRRAFEMSVRDYRNFEVMRFVRPLKCDCACCFCCLQEMDIYAPAGTLIGSVKMDCSIIFPVFTIQDASKKRVLKIKGPFCTQSTCCGDVVFDIFTADGVTKIGLMNKNFGGVLREHLTDADNFTVVFPMDLDVKMKAVLLGALILIDFIYFESDPPDNESSDLPGNLFN